VQAFSVIDKSGFGVKMILCFFMVIDLSNMGVAKFNIQGTPYHLKSNAKCSFRNITCTNNLCTSISITNTYLIAQKH